MDLTILTRAEEENDLVFQHVKDFAVKHGQIWVYDNDEQVRAVVAEGIWYLLEINHDE